MKLVIAENQVLPYPYQKVIGATNKKMDTMRKWL